MDIFKDDDFLQRFFDSIPGEKDPRQRFVVRMQYKGKEERKAQRHYIEKEFLEGFLGYPKEEILAVIAPPGLGEIDLCFVSEKGTRCSGICVS